MFRFDTNWKRKTVSISSSKAQEKFISIKQHTYINGRTVQLESLMFFFF